MFLSAKDHIGKLVLDDGMGESSDDVVSLLQTLVVCHSQIFYFVGKKWNKRGEGRGGREGRGRYRVEEIAINNYML